MTAVYVHIPFCRQKCPYCSFSSYVCHDSHHVAYVDALLREIKLWRGEGCGAVSSLFFGGGTPTVLSADLLAKIVEEMAKVFGVQHGAEISIEANPGAVSRASLTRLYDSGINRISFGVQSFDDTELKMLGRIHDRQAAVDALKTARDVGFANINIDLMFGVPGQTASTWRINLETALRLQPSHLSMYQLTLEEGTPFAKWYEEKKFALPDDDEIEEMDQLTRELCEESGLFQYEISNWARPGNECRHNLVYWHNEPYAGLGAGAVSYWRGMRKKRIGSPKEYIKAMQTHCEFICEREQLANEAAFRETVIMGLRLVDGVRLSELQNRFGIDLSNYYQKELVDLGKAQLIEVTATHLRLTRKGRALANQVMAELV